TLVATGGIGTQTWSLPSGSLPAGLSLSAAGVITGTPTGSGTSNFVVKGIESSRTAPDSQPQQKTQTLSITVNSAATSITSCPFFINTPGAYRLDVDCAVSAIQNVGIVINVSNVDLNLNGHTLSGPGAPATNCSEQQLGSATTVGINVGPVASVL